MIIDMFIKSYLCYVVHKSMHHMEYVQVDSILMLDKYNKYNILETTNHHPPPNDVKKHF